MKPYGHFNVGRWSVQWDLNVPLPRVRWYWHDDESGALAVELTNGLSDPLLCLDSPEWKPPAWAGRILDRLS